MMDNRRKPTPTNLCVSHRTHGDAGPGVTVTNNGLEANNLILKRLLGGDAKERGTVTQLLEAMLASVTYMSSRDSKPPPATWHDQGLTDHSREQ